MWAAFETLSPRRRDILTSMVLIYYWSGVHTVKHPTNERIYGIAPIYIYEELTTDLRVVVLKGSRRHLSIVSVHRRIARRLDSLSSLRGNSSGVLYYLSCLIHTWYGTGSLDCITVSCFHIYSIPGISLPNLLLTVVIIVSSFL